MKPAKDFQVHVELHGLFSVYVYPSLSGTTFQFFPYPGSEGNFESYLTTRFGHLGTPSSCTRNPELRSYEVYFSGLIFRTPEEALQAITGPRSSPTTPSPATERRS